ncbi:MAG: hypothetical protein AB2L18_11245 [Anaerolineaceae bacterium]
MDDLHFNAQQQAVLNAEMITHLFLEGPFKSGKTTLGVARLLSAAELSDPSHQILVLTPQRSLAAPYRKVLLDPGFPAGAAPTITTLSGLSRQFMLIYWPQIAEHSGFRKSNRPPTFLSMETAQYFLKQICQPLLEKGYFLEVHIDPARLFSQILDTMNKSALVGYPLEETAQRLKEAWNGEAIREKHYEQTQECALAFRAYCLENNLLDFSLQVEIFRSCIAQDAALKKNFFLNYHFLIADNLEEDVPVLHDLILDLADAIPSMLLIKDKYAGFRSFLGADPTSAERLKQICQQSFECSEQFDLSTAVHAFNGIFTNCILRKNTANPPVEAMQAYSLRSVQFYPEMITDICQTIHQLVHEAHVLPGEIAVLSPYLPDSLKFSLSQKLAELNIPYLSSRPSRTLAEEPITRAVLTFAKAAHPQWKLEISVEELRHAIMTIFPACDVIRASLLAQNTLKEKRKLEHYDAIPVFTRDRITDIIGNQFDIILDWIEYYQKEETLPLDIFLSRLFGELLSQPGFGLHENVDNAVLLTTLIQSIHDFRWMFHSLAEEQQQDVSKMYIETLQAGLLPSTHSNPQEDSNAVIISPAFTFLMKNRSVQYQFWLDIGNIGWWERLDQPLTHPYVLSRNWSREKRWTDAEEYQANQSALARLVQGLLDRCEEHVYLYVAGLNQAGMSQSSPLLSGMQLFLKRIYGMKTNE